MPYDVIRLWHERRMYVLRLFYIRISNFIPEWHDCFLVNLWEMSYFPTTILIFWWYGITEKVARRSYDSLTFVVRYRRLSSDDHTRCFGALLTQDTQNILKMFKTLQRGILLSFHDASSKTLTIILHVTYRLSHSTQLSRLVWLLLRFFFTFTS